jgi:zinc protease
MTPDRLASASDRFTLPDPGAPTPVTFPPIARTTLENGLRVWSIPHASIPVVSVALVIDAGAAQDPATRHGLASLAAHLTEEGAGGQDAIQLAETFARLGTHLDVDTGPDVTTVSFTSLGRFFEPALKVLADVVTRPHFHEADLVRVRELRLNRLRQLSRSPATPADRAYLASVFGNHPYGHGVLGTTTSVGAIALDEVRAFHRSAWRPSAATLIVAGEIEHDVVVRRAASLLGGWTAAGPVPAVAAVPPPAGAVTEVLLVERPGAPQSELRIGHSGPPRRTPDYHALVTLNNVLGGEFSSRINRNLREAKGLTYGARTAFDMRRAGGSFVAQTSVQTAGTSAAVVEILKECDAIRQDGAIQADELARAKSALTRGYVRNFEAADDFVRAAAQLVTFDLDDRTFDRFVPLVEAVSAASVVDAARTHLRPDAFTIVVVGDPDQVRPQLETLGRTVAIATPEF